MKESEAIEIFQNQQTYSDSLAKQLEEQKIKNMQLQNESSNNSLFNPNRTSDIASAQLNVEEELDKIYHLLSGHIIQVMDGKENWVEPKDDQLKIFSDYGVKQIMNIIYFYINKNTLLSYYDEKTITWKILDFGIELADLILTRYQKFFYFPAPEELFEKFLPIFTNNNKHLPKEIQISESELYNKCIQWAFEELRNKIRHYPIIHQSLVNSIDSTYRRALFGRERESLRKILHVSQSQNYSENNPFNQQKPTMWEKVTK